MAQPRGFLELTRPANAVATGVLTFTGAFVAGGVGAPTPMVFAVVATVLATGGGNAINDYFDRDIDAINRPGRPIPRGAVSPRSTLAFSVLRGETAPRGIGRSGRLMASISRSK